MTLHLNISASEKLLRLFPGKGKDLRLFKDLVPRPHLEVSAPTVSGSRGRDCAP